MRPFKIRQVICLLCTTSLLIVCISVTSSGSHREVVLMSLNGRIGGSVMLNELSEMSSSRRSDNSQTLDNLPMRYNPESGLKIILYAKHRTGSTFTSETFNRHKDVYITFEPLNFLHIEQLIYSSVDVINDTLNCRFTQLENTTQDTRRQWVRNNVFCQLENQTAGCPRVSLHREEEFCHRHRHVATKVVKLRQIEILEPLVAEGVKVIQLVRDPRGVLSSRKPHVSALNSPLDAYDSSDIYCSGVLKDLAYMRGRYRIRPGHVNRTYFLLRYEDLANKPKQTVQEIYKFLGIKPDDTLRRWTSSLSPQSPINRFLRKAPVSEEDFGTKRNDPAKTSSGWRRKLSFQEVKLVQGACQAMMEVMGYRTLSSQKELNNTSLNTLLPYNKTALLQLWWNKLYLYFLKRKIGILRVMDISIFPFLCREVSWRRHQNENLFRVTGHLWGESTGTGGFPSQWTVTQSFNVFYARLNKQLSKQSRRRWFEAPWRSLWRHCD